ncbi:MAG: dienelactone hydrolase family protein [Actinomycetota bacterium]
MTDDATTGYLAPPRPAGMPGVLLLHSWWGLDDGVRDLCERLAEAKFAALAPDLLEGALPANEAEAEATLAAVSPEVLARRVMLSIDVLRQRIGRRTGPIAIVGFAMGASMGLWAAARRPTAISTVVGYYGSQSLDFDDVEAEVLLHFAEQDDLVSEEDRVTTEALLRMGGVEVEAVTHPGTVHGFAEPSNAAYQAEAADRAWDQTIALLRRRLRPFDLPTVS